MFGRSKKSKKSKDIEQAPASFTQSGASYSQSGATAQESKPQGQKSTSGHPSHKQEAHKALEEQEQAFREGLPAGAKKLERGLSVSRSGRYKTKSRLRMSVMTDEIFVDGPSGSGKSLQGAFEPRQNGANPGSSGCRDPEPKFKEMSLPSQSTATALWQPYCVTVT